MTSLVITVRSLTGVFHGRGDGDTSEWPPSPFRLFQAIVAGACATRRQDDADVRDEALVWLERQMPPDVHAPPVESRNLYSLYVPNNGIDAHGGDPARVSELRVAKTLRPLVFDRDIPLVYHWRHLDTDVPERLPALVRCVHTLGLGIDPAFADARVLSDEESRVFRSTYPALVYRPGSRAEAGGRASAGVALPVPVDGSLAALHERHAQSLARLRPGKGGKTLFAQPRLPLSGRVVYGAPPESIVLELRDGEAPERFTPFSATAPERLVVRLRESVAASFPGREEIGRYVRGDKAGPRDVERRIRFVPLPSIGGEHADRAIRRVLVEVPQSCPVRPDAIRWALVGRPLESIVETSSGASEDRGANDVGRVSPVVLTAAGGRDAVADRYRPRGGARRWRTVTPVVLPRPARGPHRASGKARSRAGSDAKRALHQALRHAGIDVPLLDARFQREPFARRGALASRYATGPRFGPDDSSRFTHVELSFAAPVAGPLLLGDGRFCGLGLFEPADEAIPDRWALHFGRGVPASRRDELLRQLRRALMARVRALIDDGKPLPALVSGHATDGGPLRGEGGSHEHLFLRAELSGERVVGAEVCLPEAINRMPGAQSVRSRSRAEARLIDEAVSRLRRLRLGRDVVAVTQKAVPPPASGRRFETRAPYVSTRRPRSGQDRDAFVEADLRAQIERNELPRAELVRIRSTSLGRYGLVAADIEVRFARTVFEPLLLGRTSHYGGGDFRVSDTGTSVAD